MANHELHGSLRTTPWIRELHNKGKYYPSNISNRGTLLPTMAPNTFSQTTVQNDKHKFMIASSCEADGRINTPQMQRGRFLGNPISFETSQALCPSPGVVFKPVDTRVREASQTTFAKVCDCDFHCVITERITN